MEKNGIWGKWIVEPVDEYKVVQVRKVANKNKGTLRLKSKSRKISLSKRKSILKAGLRKKGRVKGGKPTGGRRRYKIQEVNHGNKH